MDVYALIMTIIEVDERMKNFLDLIKSFNDKLDTYIKRDLQEYIMIYE